jgi:hypothetical protein
MSTQTFLLMGIVFIIMMFVFSWLFNISTCNSNKEPMQYLDVYEQQDFYRNNPQVYPVPHTYTTAKFAFERAGIPIDVAERLAYAELNSCMSPIVQ